MKKRFVVRDGDERTLLDILARLGEESSAVDEGRVFVGARRAGDPNEALSVGDEITVGSPVRISDEARLLGEHEGIFAFAKPVGMPTVPDRHGSESLLRSAARVLAVAPTELHVVTRLDTNVSGVVVVARRGDATRRVTALQQAGGLKRRYLALATRPPSPAEGTWTDPVGSQRQPGGPKPSATRYRVWAKATGAAHEAALLVVEPITGRTHQIRIHASKAGAPLYGDVAYGGPARVVAEDGTVVDVARVALHAARASLVAEKRLVFSAEAPPPADLTSLWSRLGGKPADFDSALESPAFTPTGERVR